MTQHHLYISFWLTPWSWSKPKLWRASCSSDFTLCFGFGQIEYLTD